MYMFVWRCFSCSSEGPRVAVASLSGFSAVLRSSGCFSRVEFATLSVLSADLHCPGCLSACRDRNSVGALCRIRQFGVVSRVVVSVLAHLLTRRLGECLPGLQVREVPCSQFE